MTMKRSKLREMASSILKKPEDKNQATENGK
jgi:hypothetical protein